MRYGGGVGIRLAGFGALGHGSRSLARGYDGNRHWLPRRRIPLTGSFDQSCRRGLWPSSHGHAEDSGRWGGVRSPAAESNRGPPTGEPFDRAGISELKRIGDGSVPSGREVVQEGDLRFAALAGSDAGLETGALAVARHHAGRLFAVSPAFGGLCRPEVYTFPGITFSWGRQLANEWRRRGCVGARPVAGGRRPEEEGGAGSELAEPHLAWWRPSRGASPFFLLPAMKLLPAHPRRRRHPEGRSAAEEARSALPSSTWMGTMLSSCRKQENHVSFFPGPSGVRGTEGPYLTNLLADPPGATNRRRVS